MKSSTKTLFIILGIVAVFALFIFSGYNNIIKIDEDVDGEWAQVENQLQRRYDLIPNLVETVKGYASHEEETLLAVVEARNQIKNASTPAEYAAADANLTSALQGLNVVVEAYPELKANQNFLDLQTQLEGTENRIATARRDYNNAVRKLNKKVKTIPSRFFASIAGVDEREYFEIDENAYDTPDVNFE